MEAMAPVAEKERVMFCTNDNYSLLFIREYYKRNLLEVKKLKSIILRDPDASNEKYEQGFKIKLRSGEIRYVLVCDFKDYEIVLKWLHNQKR